MRFVDSHTEGEPTRVVLDGLPELGRGSPSDRLRRLMHEHPRLRGQLVDEPRGHAALVAALLLEPGDSDADHVLLFLNDVGGLPMCVHGTIGVVRTLAHLGRLPDGRDVRLDTPAGPVRAGLDADGSVVVESVPAYRLAPDVEIDTPRGPVTGDIAWGGNWFFVAEHSPIELDLGRTGELSELCQHIRSELARRSVTGPRGEPIDHIQLCGPPRRADADSRNFVLCPGTAYDRSPCGTGTCARMACLHARGRLASDELWRQESITGTRFVGWFTELDDGPVQVGTRTVTTIQPAIRGRAWLTGEGRLLFEPGDPLGA